MNNNLPSEDKNIITIDELTKEASIKYKSLLTEAKKENNTEYYISLWL